MLAQDAAVTERKAEFPCVQLTTPNWIVTANSLISPFKAAYHRICDFLMLSNLTALYALELNIATLMYIALVTYVGAEERLCKASKQDGRGRTCSNQVWSLCKASLWSREKCFTLIRHTVICAFELAHLSSHVWIFQLQWPRQRFRNCIDEVADFRFYKLAASTRYQYEDRDMYNITFLDHLTDSPFHSMGGTILF